MSKLLIELSTRIDTQLPSLFSFIVLRYFFVCLLRWVVNRKFVPRRMKPALATTSRLLCKLRNMVLATCIAVSLIFHARQRPTAVCEPYADQRAQGANAIVALFLILTQNNISSFLAVCALKGVSESSSAGLLLSCWAASHATELVASHTIFYFTLLFRATLCFRSSHTQSGVLLALSFSTLHFLFLQVVGVFSRLLSLLSKRAAKAA